MKYYHFKQIYDHTTTQTTNNASAEMEQRNKNATKRKKITDEKSSHNDIKSRQSTFNFHAAQFNIHNPHLLSHES